MSRHHEVLTCPDMSGHHPTNVWTFLAPRCLWTSETTQARHVTWRWAPDARIYREKPARLERFRPSALSAPRYFEIYNQIFVELNNVEEQSHTPVQKILRVSGVPKDPELNERLQDLIERQVHGAE